MLLWHTWQTSLVTQTLHDCSVLLLGRRSTLGNWEHAEDTNEGSAIPLSTLLSINYKCVQCFQQQLLHFKFNKYFDLKMCQCDELWFLLKMFFKYSPHIAAVQRMWGIAGLSGNVVVVNSEHAPSSFHFSSSGPYMWTCSRMLQLSSLPFLSPKYDSLVSEQSGGITKVCSHLQPEALACKVTNYTRVEIPA